MFAATIDLILVIAAWLAVWMVWHGRRQIQPVSVWEKLMVGCTLVAFSLIVRMADIVWNAIPWPALADPMVQQAIVVIGLLGGALAAAAGVAEWVPIMLQRSMVARWHEYWASQQTILDHVLRRADNAERIAIAMVHFFQRLCETQRVSYCAYRQREQEFVRLDVPHRPFTADWLQAFDRLSRRDPLVMRTQDGWLMAIPLALGTRMFGAVMVERKTDHISLREPGMLVQSAQRAAFALAAIVHIAQTVRIGRLAKLESDLERRLGATTDPVSDLMGMLDLLHRELGVEYVACLAYEGDGAYARRYSRLWKHQQYSERGLQVSIGHAVLPQKVTRHALVEGTYGPTLTPAAFPHDGLHHRAAVPLYRGDEALGLLVVASARKKLERVATDVLRRAALAFVTAVERINTRRDRNRLARRLQAFGKFTYEAADGMQAHEFLSARMLDEIPATFCQYMSIGRDGHTLHVKYRRARRGGWGQDTTGRRFELSLLPTCRMVIESGRTIQFRQDDPERQFDPQEADALFGAVPNSMLLIPVIMDGRCQAILALGELREVLRNTFTVQDRQFADGMTRLHASRFATPGQATAQPSLASLGDLNLTFASPLTGILGSVEILRQQKERGGEEDKYLDVIERNATRIREAVSDLADLTFTRNVPRLPVA